MVGTGDLRQLLTATTQAGAKTVLVGDQHQLAPVKARGGMFAQLCTDLPWTQHLSEVWRMRDPDERSRLPGAAQRRTGLGAPRRRLVPHPRPAALRRSDHHGRRRPGRLQGRHRRRQGRTAGVRHHRNGRRPQPAPPPRHHRRRRTHRHRRPRAPHRRRRPHPHPPQRRHHPAAQHRQPRRGADPGAQRATAGGSPHINPDNNRLAARRLDDNALGAFANDYVREHITHGYAVTVHSAQGVTADTTHAVLSENTTRALSYVAMTRGRDSQHRLPLPTHPRAANISRDSHRAGPRHRPREAGQHAATLLRGIIANDEHPVTAHDIAATTASESPPALVRAAIEHRALAVRDRSGVYRRWRAEAVAFDHAARSARGRDIGADRSNGEWLELNSPLPRDPRSRAVRAEHAQAIQDWGCRSRLHPPYPQLPGIEAAYKAPDLRRCRMRRNDATWANVAEQANVLTAVSTSANSRAFGVSDDVPYGLSETLRRVGSELRSKIASALSPQTHSLNSANSPSYRQT